MRCSMGPKAARACHSQREAQMGLCGFVDEDGEVRVLLGVEFGFVLPGEGDGCAVDFCGGGERFFGAVGEFDVRVADDYGEARLGL